MIETINPLEQGLKLNTSPFVPVLINLIETINPLEQGLKRLSFQFLFHSFRN